MKRTRKPLAMRYFKCPSCGYTTSAVAQGEAPPNCAHCEAHMEPLSFGDPDQKPTVDPSLCTGCGHCLRICPMGAISLDRASACIDQSLCVACGRCVPSCPVSAIRMD